MGKSAPQPPPAPDPNAIIAAQTAANNSSALLQSTLNNVQYSGPQGQVNYSLSPNNQWTETVALNPTAEATYNQTAADQYSASELAGMQLQNVSSALQQPLYTPTLQTSAPIGQIQTGYATGGPIQTGVQGAPVQTGIANPGAMVGSIPGTPVQTGLGYTGAILGQVGQTYSPFGGMAGAPQTYYQPSLYQSPAQSAQWPQGAGGQQAQSADPHAGMKYDQSSGWIPDSWYGADPSGAHPGEMYSPDGGWVPADSRAVDPRQAQGQQQGQASAPAIGAGGGAPAGMRYDQSSGLIPTVAYGVDTSGAHPGMMYDPSAGWVPADSRVVYPTSQGAGSGGPAQQPAAQSQQRAQPQAASQQSSQAANPLLSLLSNPVLSTQAATYLQAKQLLDPQWWQAAEQQNAQLVAQGLNPNDAAWQNAATLFGDQQNQAYQQAMFNAINAGDAEQNTLYGQNLSSAQFANAAQAQNFQEQLAQAGLYNSAQGQAFNQGLAQGQFANATQLQNYNELMGQAGLYNSAEGQAFGQNLAQGQFANAAQLQANNENAAQAAFNNAAYGQDFQEQYANAQLANQAAQQQFQNQAYAQELPINEFNALMGSTQVAMPPVSPAQNTQVGVPNVTGAYQLQQDAQLAAYQAQLQNSQSALGGLFNLGSAVLGKLGI